MPMILIESYEEFAQRHGNDAVDLEHRFLFSDGSQCDMLGDQRREPPDNPIALLRLQHLYWSTRAKQAEADFFKFRSRVSQQLSFAVDNPDLPVPGDEAVEHLKRLRAEAQRLRGMLASVEARLGDTPYGQRRRLEVEHETARQSELAKRAADLAAISLDGVDSPATTLDPTAVAAIEQGGKILNRAFRLK